MSERRRFDRGTRESGVPTRVDRALQHMEEQLRAEQPPEPRWDELEARVLAAIEEEEQQPHTPRSTARPLAPGWRRLAMIAAAAAVALGVYGATRSTSAPVAGAPAGAPAAEPRPAGERAAHGEIDLTSLRPGDVVEAKDAPAIVHHAGVVRWSLAPGGRAEIREAGGASARYVVALTRGSLRAEVTPRDRAYAAAQGAAAEVFAVEVERARVAVRGTIFTVDRLEDRVEVAVERGAVAVGSSERGAAEPTLLAAPARAAFSLDGAPAEPTASAPATETATAPAPVTAPVTAPAPAPVRAPATAPAAAPATAAAPEPEPAAPPSFTVASVQSSLASCFASRRHAGSTAVQTSIQSTLRISVRADGSVAGVRFDPPLKPELQTCAQFLYAGRFAEGQRDVSIPILIQE